MDETARRRENQMAYNEAHGIVPRGIKKSVKDILEATIPGAGLAVAKNRKVAEAAGRYDIMSRKELEKHINELESKMYAHAQNMEFEEAAHLRDQIKVLQDKFISL